ncbi:MAG: MFS transporter, partial [Acidobacteria bacterium]|nr:MFS transporter [Acidobacteriota bacterium]
MPPNLALVYIAGFLRALGIGLTGVILGIYLSRAGLSATAIGLVIGAGLAGAAAGTLLVSLRADQLGRRNTLVALSLLGCVGGGGVALAGALPGFALLAFLGMLNGMGRDRGPAFSLDQAILADIARPERRTWVMAWYNVLLDAGHALGALAGALPFVFRERLAVDLLASYKLTFGLCAALSLLSGTVYLFLTTRIEAAPAPNGVPGGASKISPHSKKIVARLASLIAVDALGGGFLTSALLAYWFFRRFGVSEAGLGPLFFAARLLNACSHPLAAWLAH